MSYPTTGMLCLTQTDICERDHINSLIDDTMQTVIITTKTFYFATVPESYSRQTNLEIHSKHLPRDNDIIIVLHWCSKAIDNKTPSILRALLCLYPVSSFPYASDNFAVPSPLVGQDAGKA